VSPAEKVVEYDASAWSGEGTFTQVLVEALAGETSLVFLRVEDAPASRADSAFSFISTEVFVGFARNGGDSLANLAAALERVETIGAPDYADESMLQYLRVEHVIPPYQTRGIKIIEMVRIYRCQPSGR